MQVRFDHKSEIAPGIFSLYFEPLEPHKHTAGQFVEINLRHDNPDSRGIRRWFTLSSAPEDTLMSITTRFAGKNSSSFKRAFLSLAPDTVLSFSPPEGDFVLPRDSQIKLIFAVGGIGVTPAHSMIAHLLATDEQRDVQILYGVNSRSDAIFLDTFDNYGADVELVLSNPPKNWGGASGQITAQGVIDVIPANKPYCVYLSGPEPMVEKLDRDLRSHGVPRKCIKTDFFPGYKTI